MHKLHEEFKNPADVEIIKKENILDLTRYFDGETLSWEASEGNISGLNWTENSGQKTGMVKVELYGIRILIRC